MLKNMENETEIFRAWLKKYVKIDRRITGSKLAEKIGVKPPQITHYHSGRTDNGNRTYPEIPFEIKEAILEATQTPFHRMKEIGRKELARAEAPDPKELESTIRSTVKSELEAALPSLNMQVQGNSEPQDDIQRYKKLKNAKHHELVDKFPHPELAEKLNELLLEVAEKGGEECLRKVESYIWWEFKDLIKKEGGAPTGTDGLGNDETT